MLVSFLNGGGLNPGVKGYYMSLESKYDVCREAAAN